jgi:hypothetical protein
MFKYSVCNTNMYTADHLENGLLLDFIQFENIKLNNRVGQQFFMITKLTKLTFFTYHKKLLFRRNTNTFKACFLFQTYKHFRNTTIHNWIEYLQHSNIKSITVLVFPTSNIFLPLLSYTKMIEISNKLNAKNWFKLSLKSRRFLLLVGGLFTNIWCGRKTQFLQYTAKNSAYFWFC